MKRNSFKLSILAIAALLLGFGVSSCGDDNKTNEPEKPITPVTPNTDDAMTSTEQKEYLEDVAEEFMNQMPSSDFDNLSDLGYFIYETYGEDYDWESVGDWAKDLWNDLKEPLGTRTTESDRWGYTYVYTNFKSVLMASNFTGHFTASNGVWIRTDASDLQFIFNDQKGKQCVLKLVTSGNIKRVHALNIDEYQNYNGGTEYYDRTQCIIGVPENILVTLTQGSEQVMKTTVNIDLNSLSGEEFDVSKGALNVKCITELNNGYKINVSQVAYSANNSTSASFSFTKNSKALVTAAVSSDISGIPNCNVSAFSSDFDIDNYNTDDANAQAPFVKLDILGKVQIQGRLNNVRQIVDYLEDADDNDTNLSVYTNYINKVNSLTDVHLFYNGSSTKQATVLLEPFEDYSYGGKTWYTVEPVLKFYDGTSYSTFEAFFNETSFKQTIDSFKRLANRYAALVNEHIDW